MYNNYGNFNPYMGQNRYQPMEQVFQQQTTPQMTNIMSQQGVLNGKIVESVDVVKSMDIPMDGSLNFYPIADKSMIVTKQLLNNGKSEMIIYQRVENKDVEKAKFVTFEELESLTREMYLSDIDDLKDDLKELKSQIKELKKKKKDD